MPDKNPNAFQMDPTKQRVQAFAQSQHLARNASPVIPIVANGHLELSFFTGQVTPQAPPYHIIKGSDPNFPQADTIPPATGGFPDFHFDFAYLRALESYVPAAGPGFSKTFGDDPPNWLATVGWGSSVGSGTMNGVIRNDFLSPPGTYVGGVSAQGLPFQSIMPDGRTELAQLQALGYRCTFQIVSADGVVKDITPLAANPNTQGVIFGDWAWAGLQDGNGLTGAGYAFSSTAIFGKKIAFYMQITLAGCTQGPDTNQAGALIEDFGFTLDWKRVGD